MKTRQRPAQRTFAEKIKDWQWSETKPDAARENRLKVYEAILSLREATTNRIREILKKRRTPLSYKSKSLYAEISNLPIGQNSLHDIRISFKIEKIWSILLTNSTFNINSRNKDIRLPGINIQDLFIGTTVHRTNTVSVYVACSYKPIVVDVAGVIRLSNALTRVEERLSRYIDEVGVGKLSISEHMTWLLTMWHFGADAKAVYEGERFHITYAEAEGILTRIYSKRFKDGKMRIRLERQENPNMELAKAIEKKLNANANAN